MASHAKISTKIESEYNKASTNIFVSIEFVQNSHPVALFQEAWSVGDLRMKLGMESQSRT